MPRARRLLITAGPTHEPIDAVRYLANRSSGRLGVCLAQAAREAGWSVTLLLGPGTVAPPPGVRTLRFESTADLAALLNRHFSDCDVLIMAAAVADYRPRRVTSSKLPRGRRVLTLRLERTPDLVAACAARKRPGQWIIGFALEERHRLATRALRKLACKGLDAIVANPLETMGADRIRAVLYTATGQTMIPKKSSSAPVPAPQSKREFARWLIRRLDHMTPDATLHRRGTVQRSRRRR